jgi:hypothetical protein
MTSALLLLLGGLALIAIVLLARYLEARSWRSSLLAIELHIPYGLTPDDVARFLNTIAAATHPHRLALVPEPPVALEVIADHHGIRYILLVSKGLRETVLAGLRAALPGVRVTELPDYLDTRPCCTVATEAVQSSQRRQMGVERAEGTATAVLATLQPLNEGERIVVQWILTGAGTPAPVPSMTAKHRTDLPAWLAGEELTDGEAIRSARLKQEHDLTLRAVLRIGVQASTSARANAILGRVWGQHRGENSQGVRLNRPSWLGTGWAASRLMHLRVPVTGWPLRFA